MILSYFYLKRLRQNCEILILRQPLEFGKKAEEILWRRVFYEIIHIVKTSKKVSLKKTENLFLFFKIQIKETSIKH